MTDCSRTCYKNSMHVSLVLKVLKICLQGNIIPYIMSKGNWAPFHEVYGGVQVYHHTCLTLTLHGDIWSAS
jgi:hypothetical protein